MFTGLRWYVSFLSLSICVVVLLGVQACSGPETNQPCETNAECLNGYRCLKRVCTKINVTETKPIARIDAPSQGKAKTSLVLDGSASADDQGGLLTYAWKITESPTGSRAALQNDTQVKATIVPDIGGRYVVSLVVTNSKNVSSDPAQVSIEIAGNESNKEPIAYAGPDIFGGVGDTLDMDGTGSSDPDGDPLTYQWSFKVKPEGSQADFSDAKIAKPKITFDKAGKYILELVVNDGLVNSQPDSISIEILSDFHLEPVLEKLDPATGFADTKQTVELSGKNFSIQAKVSFDGVFLDPQQVLFKNETQMSITLDLTGKSAKEYPIKVKNPGGKESQGLVFRVQELPSPAITSINPNSAPTGAVLQIELEGTGFVNSSEVLFNHLALPTTYKNEKLLVAALDLSQTAAGEYSITVKNPGNRSSSPFAYVVTAGGEFPPVLQVLNPPYATVGSKIAFSVHGSSFSQGAVIIFDGKPIPSKRVSRDTIEADPTLDLTQVAIGKYRVWVRNLDNKESTKEEFEVIDKDPAPQLDRVLPPTFYLQDVAQLDVYGKFFDPKIKLFIGTHEFSGTTIQYRSNTFFSVTVDTKQGSWSVGNIQAYVENPNGKKSQNFLLTVLNKPSVPSPKITKLSHTSGTEGQTITAFTINAVDFCPGSSTCSTLPLVLIKDTGGTDYQAKYKVLQSITSKLNVSSPYIQGNLDLTQMPAGVYSIQLEHPTTKAQSNPVTFTVSKKLPLHVSYMYPYYAKIGSVVTCDINGGAFTSKTYVKIGQDTYPLLSGTSTTRRSFDLDAKSKYTQEGNINIQICNSATDCSNIFAYPVMSGTGTTPFLSAVKSDVYPIVEKTTITLYVYGYRWGNADQAQFFLDGKELNSTNFKYSSRTCQLGSSPTSSSNCTFKQFDTTGLAVGKHTMQYKWNNTSSILYDFYIEKP